MTPFSTLLRYDCCFHAAAAMSTFSMVLHYVHFFHAAALCLRFQHLCDTSLFPMLLDYVYFIHAALLYLFSTLLRYDYFSTPSHYVYLFKDAPLCLLFPRCCAVLTFSFCPCALTTFSTQLRFVYFHALIREFSSGGGGGGGVRGVQVNPTKKALKTFFFSFSGPQLILQKLNG